MINSRPLTAPGHTVHVSGAFNSWRAETDRLWLNHKSPSLSVFLLLMLFVTLRFLPFANTLSDYVRLHKRPTLAFPNLLVFVYGSLAVSTASRYTSVSGGTATHSGSRCCSSSPLSHSNSAILAYILLSSPLFGRYSHTCFEKWADAVYPWLSSISFHGLGCRFLFRSSQNRSQGT